MLKAGDTRRGNHYDLKEVLEILWQTKDPSLLVWGPPGIGKSVAIMEFGQKKARELGMKFSTDVSLTNKYDDTFLVLDIRLSQFEAADIRGMPDFHETTQNIDGRDVKITVSSIAPPDWIPRTGKGILFFDELNLGQPPVLAAVQQIINARRIGDVKISDGFMIVAAVNPQIDTALAQELPPPIMNRFAHLELAPPQGGEWVEWAQIHGLNEVVWSYIQMHPDHLFIYDPSREVTAYPTPRTWEKLAHNINKILDSEDNDTIDKFKYKIKLMADIIVGPSVGAEFAQYASYQAILKNINGIDSIVEHYPRNYEAIEKIISQVVEGSRNHELQRLEIKRSLMASAIYRVRQMLINEYDNTPKTSKKKIAEIESKTVKRLTNVALFGMDLLNGNEDREILPVFISGMLVALRGLDENRGDAKRSYSNLIRSIIEKWTKYITKPSGDPNLDVAKSKIKDVLIDRNIIG